MNQWEFCQERTRLAYRPLQWQGAQNTNFARKKKPRRHAGKLLLNAGKMRCGCVTAITHDLTAFWRWRPRPSLVMLSHNAWVRLLFLNADTLLNAILYQKKKTARTRDLFPAFVCDFICNPHLSLRKLVWWQTNPLGFLFISSFLFHFFVFL